MSDDSSNLMQTVGTILGGVIVGAGAVGGWFRRLALQRSKDSVEIAENERDRTVANAEQMTFEGLAARVDLLENRSRRNDIELDAIRRRFRHAEDHIAKLERALSAAGIQFTPYEPLRIDASS